MKEVIIYLDFFLMGHPVYRNRILWAMVLGINFSSVILDIDNSFLQDVMQMFKDNKIILQMQSHVPIIFLNNI